MTTFQILSHLPQITALIGTGVAGLTALFSVGVILQMLNVLANIIRFIAWTIQTIVRIIRWALPIIIAGLHQLHEALIWLNDYIDWAEVRLVFIESLKVIAIYSIAAVIYAINHLRRDIPTAYFWFERNFIDVPAPRARKLEIIQIIPAKRARAAGFAV